MIYSPNRVMELERLEGRLMARVTYNVNQVNAILDSPPAPADDVQDEIDDITDLGARVNALGRALRCVRRALGMTMEHPHLCHACPR